MEAPSLKETNAQYEKHWAWGVNKAPQDLDDLAVSLTSLEQRSHFPLSVNFLICKVEEEKGLNYISGSPCVHWTSMSIT